MVVKKNGKIDIYEVPSNTDSIDNLIDRSLDNLDVLGLLFHSRVWAFRLEICK